MRTLIATILLTPSLVFSYSSGPPNGYTGAPGENNCTQCHGGNGLDSGDGSFTIQGPQEYEPGGIYTITLTLQDPGQRRWGFEFTPLDQGQITLTDTQHTQSATSGGNTYVKHTGSGTYDDVADGPISWTFEWTAPTADPGDVTFYAMGNAANSNNGTSGDFIYSAVFTSTPATGLPAAAPTGFALLEPQPNPFNPSTRLAYRLDRAGEARLEVYDLAGRLVARLADGWQPAGRHSARWNGLTLSGRPAASGVYLARLESGGRAQVKRLLLVK